MADNVAVVRILIISQYFTPELTAASLRWHPLAAGLARSGHEVDVICEVPNHPDGIRRPGYEGFAQERELDGFRTTYVWVHASESKRARHRLASYASFAASATARAGFAAGRPDVVVASSPPLSVGAVGALVAARHRVPWLFDVRDLWPEVAVALGELSEGRVLRTAEWLERRLYESAAAITTPTEPFAEHIRSLSDRPDKVYVLPNGTTDTWLRVGEEDVPRAEVGVPEDRFVWSYVGNVGLSQDLGTALAAAEALGEGFELQIVGDGTSRGRLEEQAAQLSRGNVVFRGIHPPEEAARVMRASDAVLVSLADRPELGKSIPVKLYDSCAVGRPIVLAAPGEPRRIAEEKDLALLAPAGDPVALADAVRSLRDDPRLAERIAGSARTFAAAHLRENEVEGLETILSKLSVRLKQTP